MPTSPGTIEGNAVHLDRARRHGVLVAAVSDCRCGKMGRPWLKMAAGGERASDSQVLGGHRRNRDCADISHRRDIAGRAGLQRRTGRDPGRSLPSVPPFGPRHAPEMLAKLKASPLSRYQWLLQGLAGARVLVSIGKDAIVRRVVVTFTDPDGYPTIALDYTNWTTTTVAIEAPSGFEVPTTPRNSASGFVRHAESARSHGRGSPASRPPSPAERLRGSTSFVRVVMKEHFR